jgi:hypothetical protein
MARVPPLADFRHGMTQTGLIARYGPASMRPQPEEWKP